MWTDGQVSKVIVYCPFAVYVQFHTGQKKLVCLCPESEMRDFVAEAMATYHVVPVEIHNGT